MLHGSATLIVCLIALCLGLARAAGAEPPPVSAAPFADPIAPVEAASPPAAPAGLAAFLIVPSRDARPSPAETTDASLAAAVARGPLAVRAKSGGFRKRNLDLFETERPVEIGEQEMLLRLRLRPKSSEAVSVELRF